MIWITTAEATFFFILYYLRYFRLTLDASLKIALHFLEIRAGNDSEEWVVRLIYVFYLKENKNVL